MIDTHILDLLMGGDWHPDLHPFCLHCGYDLTGSVSDRCPECGHAFSRKEIEREAYALKTQLRQLDTVNDCVRIGFRLGVIGSALVVPTVLFKWTGWWGAALGSVAGIVCGVAAFFLGLTVLRLARLPAWARQRLPTPVNYGMAYGAVFLGVILVALVVCL